MEVAVSKIRFAAIMVLVVNLTNLGIAQEPAAETAVPLDSAQIFSDSATMIVLPVAGASPQTFTYTGSNSLAENKQSVFDLMCIPSVTKDLEILDEQLEKVHAMQAEFGQQIAEQMKGLRDGSISGEEYTQLLLTREAIRAKRMSEILLPHQLERLKQIDFQLKTKSIGSFSGNNLDKSMAEKLGLNKEQLKAFKEKAAEINKRLIEDFKRMKTEAKEELLAVLTAEQRAKFSELSGSKYEEKSSDWNEYIKKYSPRKN